ncbi:Uncharacterised protein [uncultured archaeon]|nr:Uncharacterised protein [uncultured archaeon]
MAVQKTPVQKVEQIVKVLNRMPDLDGQSKKALFQRAKLLLEEVDSTGEKAALAGKLRGQIKEAIKKGPGTVIASDLAEIGWQLRSSERASNLAGNQCLA